MSKRVAESAGKRSLSKVRNSKNININYKKPPSMIKTKLESRTRGNSFDKYTGNIISRSN